MTSKMHAPETCCLEPDHYKKYFRAFYWNEIRTDRLSKKNKIGKKDKRKAKSISNALTSRPSLLSNPSQFAAFATVRTTILSRWVQTGSAASEWSDDSDDDSTTVHPSAPFTKLPKITGIGLRTVFALVSEARQTNAAFCEKALKALLDVLQGHSPEDLHQEPHEIIMNLHGMLREVSNAPGSDASAQALTSAASSCLVALSVARGEAELLLSAAASLIVPSPSLADQNITTPANLITLQRSVQNVLLGTPSRNTWLNYGIPYQSIFTSFPVELPHEINAMSKDLIVHSLASDGSYLYMYSSKGLIKVGSGYGGTIKQHVYAYKADFFPSDRNGWLGYCKNKLYVRMGRKKHEIFQVDKNTLDIKCVLRLDQGSHVVADSKTAVFTDGVTIGSISLANQDNLSIKIYNPEDLVIGHPLPYKHEFSLHLLRSRTLALGWSPFDESDRHKVLEPMDPPIVFELDDSEDDKILAVAAGQDFALLRTTSGKVFYSGKASSLGYKTVSPHYGRWLQLKETMYSRNDPQNAKMSRIVQVALGHEGIHAILVVDDGGVFFVGVARRGEDGDIHRPNRRQPKPAKPKKIMKAEGHHIIYAACNYGSTALVTRQGLLLMYGKDTQHCEPSGVVKGLKHEKIVQVALGKAHAVALTVTGLIYTFGINNKGQCGRDFGYTKEKNAEKVAGKSQAESRLCADTEHVWATDECHVCVVCRECTGFSTACQYAEYPDRLPRDSCGCGEGDSGCTVCGVCRRCAKPLNWKETEDDEEVSAASDSKSGGAGVDTEREANMKVTCLPPAKIAIPGGHKISMVACGMHHTVLMTEHGEVMTLGSNQYGQLGAGNIQVHHRIVRVRTPRAASISAGSNHTAVLTKDGELYTFGSYQKGALGRQWLEEGTSSTKSDRSQVWYATPGKVTRLGPNHATKVMWVTASGDQTFVQVSQTLVKTENLFSSTVTANKNTIVILPNRPEHAFRCITISKNDSTCNNFKGREQVDFVNCLATMDPLYDVLWCYQTQQKIMKCFNILLFDTHSLQKCSGPKYDDEVVYSTDNDFDYPNYGSMKKLNEFKNLETIETICNNEDHKSEGSALISVSILNQELAIPSVTSSPITRLHAALNLIGCLDSLTFVSECKQNQVQCKRDLMSSPITHSKEEFLTVNRFESHGGGWGYSGHSVEAIRFMVDTDMLLGGYGLFGGRGDYTTKIKLFDLGIEGGEHEGDGDLLAETEEIVFECAPRDKFPVLFDTPIPIVPNRWYVAWACINGPSSDCGSSGQTMVINEDAVFHFKSSKKSNNGTDVNAGQIPCLLYNTMSSDQPPPINRTDYGEPCIILSRKISRKVTIGCFRSLLTLLQFSWSMLKSSLYDTNGQIPNSYQKQLTMKFQRRLVYIIRASLRLVKFYINEVYSQHHKKRNSADFIIYAEVIEDVRILLQSIMSDQTPNCSVLELQVKKSGKGVTQRMCSVQFQLELTNAILNECHKTMLACFYAFFATPVVKWNHLCSLLYYVKDGTLPANKMKELTATAAALCVPKSIRDVLQYIIPMTHEYALAAETRKRESTTRQSVIKQPKTETPAKCATVPRVSQKPPPVPPRASSRPIQQPETSKSANYTEWNLLDAVPRLLDIVMTPVKRQMMTRQCTQSHEHGEIYHTEQLTNCCSKLLARLVAELARIATSNMEETEISSTNSFIMTPSRFMRVNQSRSWNTGNGSPDAICFTVDKPGVFIVGVAVYGGLGNYDYELELLHDVRQLRGSSLEENPAYCWFSVEVTHGTFTPADCHNDVAQIKFERPIPLKEDVRYALRFCNHGGRTSNGDCGLPSVKGPDGTTFRFTSCSLSFNGTTLARGQIPYIMYYGMPSLVSSDNSELGQIAAVRGMTLRIANVIYERAIDLFKSLRNELTIEDIRRNANVLHCSPAINVLIPYVLANLEGLNDSKSIVTILEMIQRLLPQLAATNLLIGSDEPGYTGVPDTTTSQYYTWVESEHPYKQSTVTNLRVLFPSSVSWILLEMDPRSVTVQAEDSLTIYSAGGGVQRQHCHCDPSPPREAIHKGIQQRLLQLGSSESGLYHHAADDNVCLEYNCTYVAVTPKLSNIITDWPQKAMLIPGNEVIFSLETATDYLNEFKGNGEECRYGFRCLVVGYEDSPITIYKSGLRATEMELAYAGAACAAKLLSPHVEIPPLGQAVVRDFQSSPTLLNPAHEVEEASNQTLFENNEVLLLSRGLELAHPPTIHQILQGQELTR